MAVSRTIEINDLTPAELAVLFTEMDGEQQAEFFAEIAPIAKTWPGAGWCQQSYDIAKHLTPEGREVVLKMAEHVLNRDLPADLTAAMPEMLTALHQYSNDLRYPPAPDSIERHLEMIERLIAKSTPLSSMGNKDVG